MTDVTEDKNPVDEVAEEFLARLRQGESPSVTEFAKRYPDLAEEIEELLPTMAAMERLRRTENVERQAAQSGAFTSPEPRRIGDFWIIREIGRGGMGVVYEAEQESLKRRVALKLLSTTASSSSRQLDRFRREAKAAGGLHHTNIVPVFGAGQDNGHNFYVMQFIDGVGLDEVLNALNQSDPNQTPSGSCIHNATSGAGQSSAAMAAAGALRDGAILDSNRSDNASYLWDSSALRKSDAETLANSADATDSKVAPIDVPASPCGSESQVTARLAHRLEIDRNDLGPGYWRSIARIGAQIADALQYAHGQKVWHRDIKPSNLLLDQSGVMWVTDFGLAKPEEDQVDVTKTGDIVGTLRYMAPEQFEGKCDGRSDIYSLGLTLYELLTWRPAYGETSHKELFRKRLEEKAPRPRTLHRGIPRDLETVILKAIAAEPRDRYQTAGEMAEDLNRFLDDRPVLARRASYIERLSRWCRRNPAIAFWIGTAASLLIAVALVASIGNIRTQQALTEVEHEKSRAEENLARSENNVTLAIGAFEEIFEKVATRGVPQSLQLEFAGEEGPQLQTVLTEADAELLRSLLGFYEEFARENDSSTRVRMKTANAYHRMAKIHSRLGHNEDASKCFNEAMAIYESLLSQDPHNVDCVVGKARVLNDRAVLYSMEMRHFFETMQAHQQARDFLLGQPNRVSQASLVRYELARSHDLLGSISIRSGMKSLLFGREDSLLKPGPPGPRDGPGRHPDLSKRRQGPQRGSRFRPGPGPSRGSSPGSQRMGGRMDLRNIIDPELDAACDLLASLVSEEPANAEFRLALAQAERHRVVHRLHTERPDEATESFQTARDLLRELVAEFPANPQYLFELADTLSLASSHSPPSDDMPTEDYLRHAIEYCQQLTRQFPETAEYQALLANVSNKLALLESGQGRYEEAEAHFELATDVMRSLTERLGSAQFYKISLAIMSKDMADSQRQRGLAEQDERALKASEQILNDTLDWFKKYAKEHSKSPFVPRITASLYLSKAETLETLGKTKEARMASEAARRESKRPWLGRHGRSGPFGNIGRSNDR